jgi:2-(1,2-epoxy-1,2-dihydrophenyl)acetyl-CoA isomerase
VVPADELTAETAQLARRLATGPTKAFGAVRRSVAYSAGHDFEDSLAFEAEMMALTGATEDHANAVASFVAKEKPTFEGR